ncbi:MAG: thioredoxin family protein [Candidatus Aenigmarchaeota archaeon]|nr:thioredoxin family protein [Candidatus Aenigmarchaeota archaeon]
MMPKKVKRDISYSKFLIAFSLTLSIFLIGVIVGNYILSYKFNKYAEFEDDLKIDLLSSEIEDRILKEAGCNATGHVQLTQSLYDLSQKLGYLENQLGWDNPKVWRMKKYYSLLELRHWLYINTLNKECDVNFTTVLYFYSNKGDCPRCESQEYVLNHLKKKYKNIFIYSFDTNMENAALNTIKQIYSVDNITPTLILEEKASIGFMDLEEIESVITNLEEDK